MAPALDVGRTSDLRRAFSSSISAFMARFSISRARTRLASGFSINLDAISEIQLLSALTSFRRSRTSTTKNTITTDMTINDAREAGSIAISDQLAYFQDASKRAGGGPAPVFKVVRTS